MDEAMAKKIAEMVIEAMKNQTAIFGMLGVIVGAGITALSNVLVHWLKQRSKTKADKPRKALLLTMLHAHSHEEHWRKFATLQHVIGADDKTARRLLLEIGARASEDGQDKWALLEYHPLEEAKRKLLEK
jgi:hypothetical protein